MKSILLLNIYIINNWKTVIQNLLRNVPHDDIIVNISFDLRYIYRVPFAIVFLKINYPKIKKFYVTSNHAKYGEILGFNKMRLKYNYNKYNICTYMHSKGVTQPNHQGISDWNELMRYFLMDGFDYAVESFRSGYSLYGVNLLRVDEKNAGKYAFRHSDFIYRGNFVTLNLNNLRGKFTTIEVSEDYYSVEGFWGKLCSVEDAFCVHESGVSHYEELYPEWIYKKSE